MKIEYYKDTCELMIYNKRDIGGKEHYEFIGSASVQELDNNLMALDGPVARPQFGQFLYQAAMMFATMQNKYLCMTRTGDIRDAALNPFEFLKNEHDKGNDKIKMMAVPEEYNDELYEWTNEDDTPVLFEAFQLEVNDNFKNNFQILAKKEYSFLPKDFQNEWGEYFRCAYDLDSNKFIDEDEPLSKPIDPNEFMSIKKEINVKRNRLKLK